MHELSSLRRRAGLELVGRGLPCSAAEELRGDSAVALKPRRAATFSSELGK